MFPYARKDRNDRYDRCAAIVAIVAIIWKPGLREEYHTVLRQYKDLLKEKVTPKSVFFLSSPIKGLY